MYSAIEKYDDRDFTEEIAGKELTLTAKTFSNIKYNQKLVDNYSCTGQAACWVISDVTNYALPLSFRKKVWERQLETWATSKGDYLQNWMKQAVKLFNEENPELPYTLKYYRIDVLKNVKDLMSVLGHSSIQTGYGGSLKEDAQDNWIIDNNDHKDWYGHAIRIIKAWYEDETLSIKYCDNYEGVNKYTVITIPDFTNSTKWFTWGYYIKKVNK